MNTIMKKSLLLALALGTMQPALADTVSNVINSGRNATHQELKDNQLTLNDILSNSIAKSIRAKKVDSTKIMRYNKIKQIAYEYGANVGRAERIRYWEQKAEQNGAKWDRDYDFSRLLIHQNPAVLPPVLSKGFDNFKSIDEKTMTANRYAIKVEVPAQIVSAIPTWRDYLKFGYTVNNHPSDMFKPRDKTEREIWDSAVKAGYEKGIHAADIDWQNAVGELKRDYDGMLNYKISLANGEINPAIIEISDLGNVVDENGTVYRNNEMMVKIVQDAYFSKQRIDNNRHFNPNPSNEKLPTGQNMR